jgi:hypothetical protein
LGKEYRSFGSSLIHRSYLQIIFAFHQIKNLWVITSWPYPLINGHPWKWSIN